MGCNTTTTIKQRITLKIYSGISDLGRAHTLKKNIDLVLILFLILGDFNIIEKAGNAAADVCDFTACNGLILEKEFNETSYAIGQCQTPITQQEVGCFVNKESICPKNSTKFPGVFASTEPCKDPKAPKLRILGELLLGIAIGIISSLGKSY